MPIYEYRCTKCGHQTELLQRVNDAPKRKCGECAGRLEKLISRTSFHLKGGGWYAEGYSSNAKKPSSSKSESTSADSSSSNKKKPAKKASSA